MGQVMVTLKAPHGAPTAQEIEQRLQLPPQTIDRQFGVIEIDERTRDFTILVDEGAVPLLRSTAEWEFSGPFSNSGIATFGPPDE